MPDHHFIYDTADLFSEIDLQQPPFLIDPILPTSGIALVYGNRSAGKTQLAFSIADALVAGKPLFGRYPCRKSRVAYFSVDMPILMVQDRVRSICGRLTDPQNFFVMAADSPINVVGADREIVWAKEIREWGPDLLILDTLHKIHKANENEAETVTTVIRALRELFGDVALMLIHHQVKETFFTKERRDEHKQRGSTAWMDDTDLGIQVSKTVKPGGPSTVHVAFPRVRYCEDQPPITTQMDPDARILVVKPNDEKTASEMAADFMAANPNAGQTEVYRFLRKHFAKGYASREAKKLFE